MFDLSKDEIARLSDVDLRELVARIVEAEGGQSAPRPLWGGAQTAPDGGVDVEARGWPDDALNDLIPRSWTAMQVKRHDMPAGAVRSEMAPKDPKDPQGRHALRPIIVELARVGGAYVIVSLDDATSQGVRRREDAMNAAVTEELGQTGIVLRFVGRNELARLVAKHPGVALWARDRIGLPLLGWRPFDAWSSTPQGVEDAFIVEPSVRFHFPKDQTKDRAERQAEDSTAVTDLGAAVDRLRSLVRGPRGAVRLAGPAGVGKSRLVQALFEDTVGDQALDRHLAVYADLATDTDPTPATMLARLLAERREAILVLDNCPAPMHSALAQRLAREGGAVRLLTVEYDVADDDPDHTASVRMEAVEPDVATALVRRRHPDLGLMDCRRIAEFADGNARLALAVARQVDQWDNVARLTDRELFARLFHQRQAPDDRLLRASRALALVYSFATDPDPDGRHELDDLAALVGMTRDDLFAASSELLARGVAQRRGQWRAVLPEAVAGWLAREALDRLPPDRLQEAFEQQAQPRLRASFARRLGRLHDHEAAKSITARWLGRDGRLGDFWGLDDDAFRAFENIAPAHPTATLLAMEAAVERVARGEVDITYRAGRVRELAATLAHLAYDPDLFGRSVAALMTLARHLPDGRARDVENRLTGLFRLWYSATQASPASRLDVISNCLASDDPFTASLGHRLLAAALEGRQGGILDDPSFGAWARDKGYWPASWDEVVAWCDRATHLALARLPLAEPEAQAALRNTLAHSLEQNWLIFALRPTFRRVADRLSEDQPWLEGWRAARSLMRYGRAWGADDEAMRATLELVEALRPRDLAGDIRAFVLARDFDLNSLMEEDEGKEVTDFERARIRLDTMARELGRRLAGNPALFSAMLPEIMEGGPRSVVFGEGLAEACNDPRELWHQMVGALDAGPEGHADLGAMMGVLRSAASNEPELAQDLLDSALHHPAVWRGVIWLQQALPMDDRGVERLRLALADPDGPGPSWLSELFHRSPFNELRDQDLADLVRPALVREGGPHEILDGVCMLLHTQGRVGLGPAVRNLAVECITTVFRSADEGDPSGMTDHRLTKALEAILPAASDAEVAPLVAAWFERVRRHHFVPSALSGSGALLAERAPEAFLDAAFLDPGVSAARRRNWFKVDFGRTNPFARLPADRLTAWTAADPGHRVPLVWDAIPHHAVESDQRAGLSPLALALLDVSDEPQRLVGQLAQNYPVGSFSGHYSDFMARHRDVLASLLDHPNPAIREVVVPRLAEMDEEIAERRRREATEEAEWSQRFE